MSIQHEIEVVQVAARALADVAGVCNWEALTTEQQRAYVTVARAVGEALHDKFLPDELTREELKDQQAWATKATDAHAAISAECLILADVSLDAAAVKALKAKILSILKELDK